MYQQSLLAKYGIPVQHLDYQYVKHCRNAKELEQILQILRSGEEGYYPDLTENVEEKLRQIKPKSKLLREGVTAITKEELGVPLNEQINVELHEFLEKIRYYDKQLTRFGRKNSAESVQFNIRPSHPISDLDDKKGYTQRIKSTDYVSWDRYDVETECIKIELEEEKLRKTCKKQNRYDNSDSIDVTTKKLCVEAEIEHEANMERSKGNEYYNNSDYKQAIKHYSRSIGIKPTAAAYTNRAMANIKLKNYQTAIQDCQAALRIQYYVKAYVRMAQSYEALHKFDEALLSIDYGLRVGTNDKLVQMVARHLERYRKNEKRTRFMIEDVEMKKGLFVTPIPGTSQMNPPSYVTGEMSESVRRKVEQRYRLGHIINIDNDSDVEEECTINHLEHVKSAC